ncbi:MAG: DNA polymerase III subunit gamma/tau [bacterium]|nr:DNA polymerase III subunit gamma/tau [bacterium]
MSKTRKQPPKASADQSAYVVLARKYRPSDFDELIGQRGMVQTLGNAFKLGRIAQGFMLTGVRGVGKTTTARILARALNYELEGASKNEQGATIDMPEPGVHCQAIMESRHVDVLEMDAASHTGIDDIREIIESTRYKPLSARYKVYIIDEAHMLSKSAFNALLKTLEEPPEHVKFIFATTEVQKVPVTVLSRCQRFDLRRVEMEELVAHFAMISKSEGAKVDPEALALIAQAAQGSVRDGLSILDQAIAHAQEEQVSSDDVRGMLGLADRMRIFDLLTSVLKGDAADALEQCQALFTDGAEPARILIDLAETTHILTRKKILDDRGAVALSESERGRVKEMAGKLSMPVLSRCWQMLLKGIDECSKAPNQIAAVDMILIRISYAADLPSPEELARAIQGQSEGASKAVGGAGAGANHNGAAPRAMDQAGAPGQQAPRAMRDGHGTPASTAAISTMQAQAKAGAFHEEAGNSLSSFEDIAELIGRDGGLVLKIAFEEHVRPIRFEHGTIEISLANEAPRGLANDIKRLLNNSTGDNWMVVVADRQGDETLNEKKQRELQSELAKVKRHPLVKEALKLFPDARITDIRAIKKNTTDTKEGER